MEIGSFDETSGTFAITRLVKLERSLDQQLLSPAVIISLGSGQKIVISACCCFSIAIYLAAWFLSPARPALGLPAEATLLLFPANWAC